MTTQTKNKLPQRIQQLSKPYLLLAAILVAALLVSACAAATERPGQERLNVVQGDVDTAQQPQPVNEVAKVPKASEVDLAATEATDSNTLAANPELAVARRYASSMAAETTAETRDTATLADNPELAVASRYSAAPDTSFAERTANELVRQQNFVAAHTRPAAVEHEAVSSILTDDPELAVAGRYLAALDMSFGERIPDELARQQNFVTAHTR